VQMCSQPRCTCVLAMFLLVSLGCATKPLFMRERAADELLSAETALADGHYYLARMKYAIVLEDHPQSETARFGLGLSHFRLAAYENAARCFLRYLDDFPEGLYADEARHYLSEIEGIEEARRTEQVRRAEEAWLRVAKARDAVERRPDNARLRIEFGNAYWDLAEFDDAAEQYRKAVELDPRLHDHPMVRARIEFGPNGAITVLTPQEVERRDREANPIVIESTRGYRAGRSSFDFQHLWYVVSGQVRNQSSRTVRGVVVEATIFNLSGNVLDTTQYYIGTMSPGAVRSFAARLVHFETIDNVYRYECNVIYR